MPARVVAQPGAYGVTEAGAILAGSPMGADYEHTLALVDLCTCLEQSHPLRTERELTAEIYAGGLPQGARPHLPDANVNLTDGRPPLLRGTAHGGGLLQQGGYAFFARACLLTARSVAIRGPSVLARKDTGPYGRGCLAGLEISGHYG